jgi:uncharacterized protein (DUF58 family)
MLKIMVTLVLIYALVFTAAPVLAATRAEAQAQSTEQVKAKVAQLGTGQKARATVRLKNGTKLKGYIEQSGEQEFVLRDKETGSSVRVLYTDVEKVEERKGHSTAKWVGIGAAIGAGAFLAILAIAFSQLND